MTYLSRRRFAAVALTAVPLSRGQSTDADFNGRWNIKAENESRKRVWWLEVTGAGTPQLKGRFVGAPGGDLDTIEDLSLNNGELRFTFQRVYRRNPGLEPQRQRGVYTARLKDGKLVGRFLIEGEPASPVEWLGVRAPVIRDREDGQWRRAETVVLFDGSGLEEWQPVIPGRPLGWRLQDGLLVNEAGANNLESRRKFWNFEFHAEYRLQPRSNSGIGLRGRYEVQIQEDFGKPPNNHGHGSLYSRITPVENASRRPGEWQELDIRLVGRIVTVKLNGRTVIDKAEVEGLTAMATDADEDRPGPIVIQGDHMPVEFRKVSVTPLVR